MGIPPEETQAFKTDIRYRLNAERAMEDVLGREGIDEVILTFSEDMGDQEFDYAENPSVAEYLRDKLHAGEDLIEYVTSFEDSKVHGKLANEIRKSIQDSGQLPSLEALKKIGEPLRPRPLTPLEIALYSSVEGEKNLTNWLGREIRLLKKEYGPEIDNADVIQFLFPLQSIKDWYVSNDRPALERLSFKDAYDQAVAWEKAMAGKGEGLYYGPVLKENILFLDPKTGFSVQEVKTENDLEVEGNRMHHCVGGYFERVNEGDTRILSLRDPGNHPHITIELNGFGANEARGRKDKEWRVNQIKGFANQMPKPEYREILKRYFMTIPGLRYVNQRQSHERKLGFCGLAVESAVGLNRWEYDPSSADHGRPDDLTDAEMAAVINEHAKNIMAVVQHAKRYPSRIKKGEYGLRYETKEIGIASKSQKPDDYGIMFVTENTETTRLNTTVFGGDIRIFLGDVWLDSRDRDIPLTPVLKEAIDNYTDALVESDRTEKRLYDRWKKGATEFLKQRKAVFAELTKIGPERFTGEHLKKGLLKDFYAEQKRPERMPYPSYANQLYLLESDIKRAQHALDENANRPSISERLVRIAPFSVDSFSKCAQKMLFKEGEENYVGTDKESSGPHGKWNRDGAVQYFALTVFEKINGCPMFADDE